MAAQDIDDDLRREDFYHHIDMGFLNRRLALSSLPPTVRDLLQQRLTQGGDHISRLLNDHALVTAVIDMADRAGAPTLIEALQAGKPRLVFRSTERLEPCPAVYTEKRVEQRVLLPIEFGKPVILAYHTEHIVSDTGRMSLAHGADGGHIESMVGLLHDRPDRYEIEPLVIGAPTLEHPRNGDNGELAWLSLDHGEILPEDIDQFAKMKGVVVSTADEWMSVMQKTPEKAVKEAFAALLAEPSKSDWGGERNDLFSAAVSVAGRRRTAAFLLKGPTKFREMTLEMCGARADQVLRLAQSGADISVVQHSHTIGEAVRLTLRELTVRPGQSRKFCVIDGQATYRILKAYGFV